MTSLRERCEKFTERMNTPYAFDYKVKMLESFALAIEAETLEKASELTIDMCTAGYCNRGSSWGQQIAHSIRDLKSKGRK